MQFKTQPKFLKKLCPRKGVRTPLCVHVFSLIWCFALQGEKVRSINYGILKGKTRGSSDTITWPEISGACARLADRPSVALRESPLGIFAVCALALDMDVQYLLVIYVKDCLKICFEANTHTSGDNTIYSYKCACCNCYNLGF